MKNRANRALRNGNTDDTEVSDIPHKKTLKQGNQCLRWCFTLNNYTLKKIEHLVHTFEELSKKYIFQEEIGESGTPHLQGCFWLKTRLRLTQLKKQVCDKSNFSQCRNWKASVNYCKKTETRVGKIFLKGIPRPIKILTDNQLYDWQKSLIKIIKKEPDDRKNLLVL